MFDQLFKCRSVVARHREGPVREERFAYLTHLANQGYARNTLRQIAKRGKPKKPWRKNPGLIEFLRSL